MGAQALVSVPLWTMHGLCRDAFVATVLQYRETCWWQHAIQARVIRPCQFSPFLSSKPQHVWFVPSCGVLLLLLLLQA